MEAVLGQDVEGPGEAGDRPGDGEGGQLDPHGRDGDHGRGRFVVPYGDHGPPGPAPAQGRGGEGSGHEGDEGELVHLPVLAEAETSPEGGAFDVFDHQPAEVAGLEQICRRRQGEGEGGDGQERPVDPESGQAHHHRDGGGDGHTGGEGEEEVDVVAAVQGEGGRPAEADQRPLPE